MLIPEPTIQRLCMILRRLEPLRRQGALRVSSADLGRMLNLQPHSIRKDFSFLSGVVARRSGYEVTSLEVAIRSALGLDSRRKACVVGLGRIGTAILLYGGFEERGYPIIAGFDSNTNRIETLPTSIRLYPAHEMELVVAREGIELGIITVPAAAAQGASERLVRGGIKGIINFAPTVVRVDDPSIPVRNVDLVNELDIVSAMMKG